MTIFHKNIKQSVLWRGLYFFSLLLLNIFLSRYLKAEGIGALFYLSNFFSLLIVVLGFNMDGSFTYFSSSKTIHHNKLAFLGIFWTILVSIVTYLLLSKYFIWFNKDMLITQPLMVNYGLRFIVGILLTSCFTMLFYSVGNYFLPNIILSVCNLLTVAIIAFANQINLTAASITNIYFYLILFQGLLLSIAFIYKNGFSSFYFPTIKEQKQLVKYAAVGLSGNIIFFFVYKLDYWFVNDWCHQSGHLGNYIQASKLSQMLLILPQILAMSILPQMASGQQHKEVVQTILKLFKSFLILFIFLFFLLLLTGKFIFSSVFGASFSTMYLPMIILLPGIFCLSISSLLSAYFSGKNQNKYNLYAAVVALIVMLSLSFLLKSIYSIYIAAAISSIAYSCEALFCFIKFIKQEKINVKQLLFFTKEDWQLLKKTFTN